MTRTLFVTGTGTDVGKTVVTRGILGALRRYDIRVTPLKPVESGALKTATGWRGGDADALCDAAGRPDLKTRNSAYLFRTPVSPHLAARKEKQTIDQKALVAFVNEFDDAGALRVVEGAGGLLVPLTETLLYADIIPLMGAELIIVAPNILGAINATLTTIEAARHRRIPILGIILNGTAQTELGNKDAITYFGQVPYLGCFPTSKMDDDTLAQAALDHLDLRAIAKRTLT